MEKETSMSTQAGTKTGLKNPVTQLEISKENLTSRMSEVEDSISGLEDNIEELDQISKK